MQTLAEKILCGRWCSFKVFKSSGEIKVSTKDWFREVLVKEDRSLSIRTYKEGRARQDIKTEEWKIAFRDKRFYLEVPKEAVAYEIITINHTVLVLLDPQTQDKVFFAREEHWQSFLISNQQVVL